MERWLNRDPIGTRGGLNLYGYVEQNPIMYVDPLGLHHQGDGCVDGCGNSVPCPRDICVTAECVAGIPPNPPPSKRRDCVFKCMATATVGCIPTAGQYPRCWWAALRGCRTYCKLKYED